MSEISHKDLVEWGQEHLAEAIEQMSPDEQDRFLEPFNEAPIPWLLSSIRGTAGEKGNEAPLRIVPPEAVDGGDRDSAQSRAAYEKGIELLKAGKIGILLVCQLYCGLFPPLLLQSSFETIYLISLVIFFLNMNIFF